MKLISSHTGKFVRDSISASVFVSDMLTTTVYSVSNMLIRRNRSISLLTHQHPRLEYTAEMNDICHITLVVMRLIRDTDGIHQNMKKV